MVKLKDVEFPIRYLNCYEAVIITILKHMGLVDETPLMGTQAYFVLRDAVLGVQPGVNSEEEEWKRVHGLTVERSPIANEVDLRDEIVAKLNNDMPVCLIADLYFLPHTPYYRYQHYPHYINIFGYDNNNHYYMICPYYRFRGWVDSDLIHTGFFSPALPAVSANEHLVFVPELKLETLSPERVCSLVQENCQYMLGLAAPEVRPDLQPHQFGLLGIRTFSALFQELVAGQRENASSSHLLVLSSELRWIGYSRYWLHKLIQTCEEYLLPEHAVVDIRDQFMTIVESWKDISIRLGASVHGNRLEEVERIPLQLEGIYRQEERLFNSLLGMLPNREEERI
jgi:hypothetical protein